MYCTLASQVALVVKNLPASAGDRRDAGFVLFFNINLFILIPGSGRSSGGGH